MPTISEECKKRWIFTHFFLSTDIFFSYLFACTNMEGVLHFTPNAYSDAQLYSDGMNFYDNHCLMINDQSLVSLGRELKFLIARTRTSEWSQPVGLYFIKIEWTLDILCLFHSKLWQFKSRLHLCVVAHVKDITLSVASLSYLSWNSKTLGMRLNFKFFEVYTKYLQSLRNAMANYCHASLWKK